jgi:hypothetical protein
MKIFLMLTLSLGLSAAWAAPVEWTIEAAIETDYTYDAFTGTFYYDADTNQYSDIDIILYEGTSNQEHYLAETLNFSMGDSDANQVSFIDIDYPYSSSYGFPVLELYFSQPLTNSGGVVYLAGTSEYVHGELSDDFGPLLFIPNPDDPERLLTGTVTSSAVPVPAAIWLFGSGLAGLGWLRRKQTA